MLGSEVIKQIQNLIDEYGDLPIEISLNGSPILDIDCIYKIIGASMDIEKPKILIEEGYVI